MTVRKADIVVAGAGMAGLSAARAAQRSGARVVVLEKAHAIGGSAAASGGSIWCAATLNAWLEVQPGGDPDLGRVLVEGFGEGIAWLADQGVGLERLHDTRPYKFERIIYQLLPDAAGALAHLAGRIADDGGDIVTEAGLQSVDVTDDGRIEAVRVRRPEGVDRIETRSVVLATGGFQGSAELRARYLGPWSDRIVVRGVPQNTGDGLRAALAVGADAAGPFSRFYGHLLPAAPARVGLDNFVKVKPDFCEHAVLLNLDGERFEDEYLGDEVAVHALARQREATAVLVFDQGIRDALPTLLQWPGNNPDRIGGILEAGGEILQAPDVEDLATQMRARWGVAKERARRTLREYDAACAHGDPSLLTIPKTGGLRRLDTPPLHAVRVLAGATFTYGGIRVNGRGEALDTAGRPIPGLFAAGADCGGVYTRGYTGGLSMAMVFGRLAGTSAGAFVCRS